MNKYIGIKFNKIKDMAVIVQYFSYYQQKSWKGQNQQCVIVRHVHFYKRSHKYFIINQKG